MTQAQQSNYWIRMREDKFTKLQQQGLAVPNPDSVNLSKHPLQTSIKMMELKIIRREIILPRNYYN